MLAVIAGREAVVPVGVLEELQDFIYGVFSDFPDETVSVSPIHSRDAALQYTRENEDG